MSAIQFPPAKRAGLLIEVGACRVVVHVPGEPKTTEQSIKKEIPVNV